MTIRLILNGKKASLATVRQAVSDARERHNEDFSVRVTYEYGDVHRFVADAINDGVSRIIIGGGDGSVNEVVDALMQHAIATRPQLAILPLGTANDFATACRISPTLDEAFDLALTGQAQDIDVIQANDRFFVNVASGGFGAHITSSTPVELKNFIGGGAYTLVGLIKAIGFKPYQGILTTAEKRYEAAMIVGAICNGRQAGGGQQLAPNAYLNDGLLDVMAILEFPVSAVNQVLRELNDHEAQVEYVLRLQQPWVEYESNEPGPLNLDGEPYPSEKIRFEVQTKQIKMVVPENCPCLC